MLLRLNLSRYGYFVIGLSRTNSYPALSYMQYGDYYLVFINSLLQMQGLEKRESILKHQSGNILLWNGEAYSGLDIDPTLNDGKILLNKLDTRCSKHDITVIFSSLRGPWAFIYYDSGDEVIYWGRDFMGRKSLILRGGFQGSLLTIASVATYQDEQSTKFVEVVPGLYRMELKNLTRSTDLDQCSPEMIPWSDHTILRLSNYARNHSPSQYRKDDPDNARRVTQELMHILLKSVTDRCTTTAYSTAIQQDNPHFMLLFSGGVDSTLLAALLHKALPVDEPIELCSICFAKGDSPDRLGALDAYVELKSIYPEREWKFIAINSTYEELKCAKEHIVDLLYPADTIMDFNIGGALWLAAKGKGALIDVCTSTDCPEILMKDYESKARVVFLGHGADELFGGYGRHRTKYKNGGWHDLAEELRLDVRRLWQRNFGRDDRIISDHGKESRIPFVDERVLDFALSEHLGSLVNLELPIGVGDKIILRRCLKSLGLVRASERHKRALQFGSRLAKAANKDAFGSNAAANRRHGGKVKINDCDL